MTYSMLFQSYDVEIDGVQHACFTCFKDGTPTITIGRPKRRGRPVYSQQFIMTPKEVSHKVLVFDDLPQQAKVLFNNLGVHK